MPDWSKLSHAFGSAEDLPSILSGLDPDPNAEVWAELWGRVCHQGTTYTSSPFVLPYLLQAASTWTHSARAMPLTLAGHIVSADEFSMQGHESTVAALECIAIETLSSRELTRSDRIFIMESALAFGGDRLWGRSLNFLNDGEFPGVCPNCALDLYLVIGDEGHFSAEKDWVRNPDVPRNLIQPAIPEQLNGTAKWLFEKARDSGDRVLRDWISYLFGTSVCPHCEKGFIVATAVEKAAQPG